MLGSGEPSGARALQAAVELGAGGGQTERFEGGFGAGGAGADEGELAQVGDQHQAVARPVAGGLLAHRRRPRIIGGRLHLHHAAFGRLPRTRAAALHLPRGVEAEVGMAGALIGQLADAEHARPEGRADRVEQRRQRRVVRPFAGGAPGGANPPQRRKVILRRGGQPPAPALHRPLWYIHSHGLTNVFGRRTGCRAAAGRVPRSRPGSRAPARAAGVKRGARRPGPGRAGRRASHAGSRRRLRIPDYRG